MIGAGASAFAAALRLPRRLGDTGHEDALRQSERCASEKRCFEHESVGVAVHHTRAVVRTAVRVIAHHM